MQAEPAPAHPLWVRVGCTTSAAGSGILGSFVQTRDIAWGYSEGYLPNPLHQAFVLHPEHPQWLLLGAQVLAGGRAGDTYLFGGPVPIPEEAAAAVAPL